MARLFARRYLRRIEAVSRTEQVLGGLILLLTAGLVAGFVVHVTTGRGELFAAIEPAGKPGGEALPAIELQGWCGPTSMERFAAEELYIKVDGRAEAYLRLGAVGLTFGRYVHEDEPQRAVDVYWFDMGTADHALAAYRSEKPPDVAEVPLGAAAYEVGGAVFLCQGSSYIQVIPSRTEGADAQAARQIAESLSRHLAPSPSQSPARRPPVKSDE